MFDLSGRIKNVAVAGHGGSGKTSLCEAILYLNGVTDRLGKIADGNTYCDFDAEEIKRKASVSLTIAPLSYNNTKINLLDTPGMFDFSAGLIEGLNAADSVVICLSGKSGVTVGAQKAYALAKKNKMSRIIFISKLDSHSADFYKVLESLKAEFGPKVCPIVVPYYVDHEVECYINLIEMKAYKYSDGGKRTEVPMPDFGHRTDGLMAAISEAVAETDEKLFEKYFSGEKFTEEEIIFGIKQGVKNSGLVPVLCGSALNLEGIDILMNAIDTLLPSANEIERVVEKKGDIIPLPCDDTGKTAALVFKTIADPFVGKMSLVKVLSGKLTPDISLMNSRTEEAEKIGKLLYMSGKKQSDVTVVGAGDICAIAKLSQAQTGDVLADAAVCGDIESIPFETPCLSMAMVLEGKGDESKIASAVSRLLEEDKTLNYTNNVETHQSILSGIGEQHLDVVISKLKSKFGISVNLETPITAYRETITKKVKVQGRHKKQTGGHGQFGDVHIEFEPNVGDDLVFEERVFGGAVPKGFFPAVEKGLRDCIKKGVVAGYPVVGLKATLVDGSYHPVDSSEMAFKMAATIAYKEGMKQAGPVLLEPIGHLKAYVPDSNTGDVIGELNKRRGRMLGMDPDEGGLQRLEAEVPMAEMNDFSIVLRSITQGRGRYELEFSRYERLPGNLEAKVIAESKNNVEE